MPEENEERQTVVLDYGDSAFGDSYYEALEFAKGKTFPFTDVFMKIEEIFVPIKMNGRIIPYSEDELVIAFIQTKKYKEEQEQMKNKYGSNQLCNQLANVFQEKPKFRLDAYVLSYDVQNSPVCKYALDVLLESEKKDEPVLTKK